MCLMHIDSDKMQCHVHSKRASQCDLLMPQGTKSALNSCSCCLGSPRLIQPEARLRGCFVGRPPRLLCLIWLEKIINSWNQIGNHQLENMSHESINIIKSSIRNWQKISRNQNPIKVQKLTFGTPIAGWFRVENRIYKWLIWGYAHGLETSIFLITCFSFWTRIKSTRSQVTLAASIPLPPPLCCCRTWRCPSLGLECGPWQWNYFCSCVGSFFLDRSTWRLLHMIHSYLHVRRGLNFPS